MTTDKPLQLGDTIACYVQHPQPATIQLTVLTPAALEFARDLLAGGPTTGWWRMSDPPPERPAARYDGPPCSCAVSAGHQLPGCIGYGEHCRKHLDHLKERDHAENGRR